MRCELVVKFARDCTLESRRLVNERATDWSASSREQDGSVDMHTKTQGLLSDPLDRTFQVISRLPPRLAAKASIKERTSDTD